MLRAAEGPTFGRGAGQDQVLLSFLHHLDFEERLVVLLLDVTNVLTASEEQAETGQASMGFRPSGEGGQADLLLWRMLQ